MFKNKKLQLGLLGIVLGIGLLLTSYFAQHKEETKTFWQKCNDFFTHNPMWNPLIEFFGGTPQSKPMGADNGFVYATFLGGIVLVALGGAAIFIFKKRKSKRYR